MDTSNYDFQIDVLDNHIIPDTDYLTGTVAFVFDGFNQCLVSSDFATPCVPNDPSKLGSFWTGPMNYDDRFGLRDIDANTTIFYYSPMGDDCVNGVVGVINPTARMNLVAYRAAAAAFNGTVTPPSSAPYGGAVMRHRDHDDMGHGAGALLSFLFFVGFVITFASWYLRPRIRALLFPDSAAAAAASATGPYPQPTYGGLVGYTPQQPDGGVSDPRPADDAAGPLANAGTKLKGHFGRFADAIKSKFPGRARAATPATDVPVDYEEEEEEGLGQKKHLSVFEE